MRVIPSRLSLLTVTALIALSTPAGAADQGDVGIVDGTVRVVAIATIPGESWGADNACTYEAVIDDDLAFGVYEVDGTRMYSDTGRWLRKICDGETVDVGGFFVFPEGDGYSTPDMLQQAIDVLDPPEPELGSKSERHRSRDGDAAADLHVGRHVLLDGNVRCSRRDTERPGVGRSPSDAFVIDLVTRRRLDCRMCRGR